MKKRLAFIIAWVLALTLGTGAALAETSYAGQVAPGETVHIQSPFTASVEQVSAETGDFVHAGDALFALTTTKIYAPCDGTVQGVLAQEGDRLEAYMMEEYRED